MSTPVDTLSSFSPLLDARLSQRIEGLFRSPNRAGPTVGYPTTIRVDRGSDFVSRDLDIGFVRSGHQVVVIDRQTGPGLKRASRMEAKCRPVCVAMGRPSGGRSQRAAESILVVSRVLPWRLIKPQHVVELILAR